MCVVVAPGGLVRRALELEGAARRRARCLRGAAVNAALLLALAADLSCKCEGYTSALHWVELALAGVAGANLLRLALALARPPPPPLPLRPDQRRLLALTDTSLDSSFRLEEPSAADSGSSPSLSSSEDELSMSLSPARSWRGASGTGSAPSPPPSPEHSPERAPRDCFISDRRALADYLQQYERQQAGAPGPPPLPPSPPPAYQLAAAAEGSPPEGGAGPGLSAAARRLHLDPARLTEFNLNLRIWLHVTILSRLSRELESVQASLARLGLASALPEWPNDRLRALASAAHAPPALGQLLPFLDPWPNRAYVIQRIHTLARGGALSEYRGARGGGAGRGDADPTDAELLLHLFAAYVDGQLPSVGVPRPFTSAFLSKAPATPPRPLALHRLDRPTPHYVVVVEGEALDVGYSPRSNLLHALLVFIGGAMRLQPAPLRRTALGPAGLNLLWVIGR